MHDKDRAYARGSPSVGLGNKWKHNIKGGSFPGERHHRPLLPQDPAPVRRSTAPYELVLLTALYTQALTVVCMAGMNAVTSKSWARVVLSSLPVIPSTERVCNSRDRDETSE